MLTLTHQNSGGPYLTITENTVIVEKANNSYWTVSTCDMGGMSYRFSFTVLSGDNAIMIRFSDSSNADHYRSAEGYGVYTYYANNSQLYYYNDPSGAFLTGNGAGNGTYSVGDLIAIEYSIADGCIKIYKNNALIVSQKTKYRRYVQFVTSGGLSAASITINYSLNTSQAVNATSFAKYIASCCRYIGNTALSSEHQTDVTNFLLEGIAYPKAAINIKTAIRMINKLRTKLKLSSILESSNQQILSVNAAKILISTYLPTSDIDSFTTFMKYYGAAGKGGAAAVGRFIRIAPTTAYSALFTYSLIGGGGGGSGAICGDGDKNASYTVTSGRGGKGGESRIILNGSVVARAAGGNGGNAVSKKVGGNPSLATNGNSGNAGKTVTSNFSIPAVAEILIAIGGGEVEVALEVRGCSYV